MPMNLAMCPFLTVEATGTHGSRMFPYGLYIRSSKSRTKGAVKELLESTVIAPTPTFGAAAE